MDDIIRQHLTVIWLIFVSAIRQKQIDAKLSLSSDLCPLCPRTHYLVTNEAEGWLKPPTDLLDETTVGDESRRCFCRLLCLSLDSFSWMLVMVCFWYGGRWHHVEVGGGWRTVAGLENGVLDAKLKQKADSLQSCEEMDHCHSQETNIKTNNLTLHCIYFGKMFQISVPCRFFRLCRWEV